MKKNLLFGIANLALCFTISSTLFAASEDDLVTRARGIHERVMTLDTHVDIPFNFATSEHSPASADAQVNLDSMIEGGLDSAFFIVYVGQAERTEESYLAAKADAITKFDAIHRMADVLYPDRIGLAETAAEAQALHAEGKLVALIGIENGFVIGKDISLLEYYRQRGARYMTLVHNGHNDIGDSAQPQERFNDMEAEHGGLSDFGFEVVEEMNRLGILVDISHVSRQTMLDATRHSQVPVIASHSSVTSMADHPRNMNDEQLLALQDNGGVVQIVAFNPYLRLDPPSSVDDLVDHIDYAVNLIGVEHVGISSDFGGGGGIEGWSGALETFNVTLELVRRGYSEEDIAMIWGGNVLRILATAERFSDGSD
jgi:membrane dipeptidase